MKTLFKIKQNIKMTKNRDVDINPCLSRNEPMLEVTDFNRACHVYILNFYIKIVILIDSN